MQTGVYLLALRHPGVVARQLATIALLAPGRFTFGVGVGGDDPASSSCAGSTLAHRGARTTEGCAACASSCRASEVDFRGRFFELHGAIRPAPAMPDPGSGRRPLGRGARTDGQLGDGWLGLWVSPRRFAEAIGRIEAAAAQARRGGVRWQHALQLWAGFGASRARARQRLARDDGGGLCAAVRAV